MKVLWDVQCSRCEEIFEVFIEREHSKSYEGDCPACGPNVLLERAYIRAPGISFGGISGAVQGSGFYATDYRTTESDLVRQRAIEHAEKLGLDPRRKRSGKKKTGS